MKSLIGHNLVIALLAVLLLNASTTHSAQAEFVLSAVGDFEYSAGGADDSITIQVADSVPASEDFLGGWQLSLQIVADPGATGEISFTGASLPTDYLLDGVGLGPLLPTFSSTNYTDDGIFALDFDVVAGIGVPIPGTPANLMDLQFEASNDASGTFRLLALPGVNQTLYIEDLFAGTEFEFDNVTLAGGPLTLGTFTASVSAVPVIPANLWYIRK